MESIQTRMETLRVELKDEYGTDNISIQDGTINYETNDKENGEVNKKD